MALRGARLGPGRHALPGHGMMYIHPRLLSTRQLLSLIGGVAFGALVGGAAFGALPRCRLSGVLNELTRRHRLGVRW